eukprot:6622382-Pyramimonas_sp.AAC.1
MSIKGAPGLKSGTGLPRSLLSIAKASMGSRAMVCSRTSSTYARMDLGFLRLQLRNRGEQLFNSRGVPQ